MFQRASRTQTTGFSEPELWHLGYYFLLSSVFASFWLNALEKKTASVATQNNHKQTSEMYLFQLNVRVFPCNPLIRDSDKKQKKNVPGL